MPISSAYSRSSTRAISRSPCSSNSQISRFLGTLGRSRRFTRDEENRAFCSLEQFRRHLTEEKLVARPRTYTHHQKIVTTDVELAENGFLRRSNAAHRTFHLDPIVIAQLDNLANDGFGTAHGS